MTDIERINSFLQEKLLKEQRNEVRAVEAASWLDRVGLLRDSKTRPGKNLRKLLREGCIHGQQQRPNKPNGRWFIQLDLANPETSFVVEGNSDSGKRKIYGQSTDISAIVSSLCNPIALTSREAALRKDSPIPRCEGLYAWYFRNMPPVVPVEDCTHFEEYYLMYVGISPRKEGGKGNLRKRIQTHFGKTLSNNASRSTLRLSLGCLLSEHMNLDIDLQRVSGRVHFNDGERLLSEWMSQNAKVIWCADCRPWEIEKEVIWQLYLPLNLDHNTQHPFYNDLLGLRKSRKNRAT